jgi:hypothetical protein
MGTFVETAIIDGRLSFANKGKQNSVCRFRLQQTNVSRPFSFSVCSNQAQIAVFRLFRFSFALSNKNGVLKR